MIQHHCHLLMNDVQYNFIELEIVEHREPLVHQDHLVHPELLVLLVHPELLVLLVHPELLVLLVHPELLVHLEHLVPPELLAHPELLVHLEHQVLLEHLVYKAIKEDLGINLIPQQHLVYHKQVLVDSILVQQHFLLLPT